MFTIQLNDLLFFTQHGLHAEEALTGTKIGVDAAVKFKADSKITSIEHTVNYAEVYAIIKKHMSSPVALLETLAQQITDEIGLLDGRISSVEVRIKKLNPPIKHFSGNVAVTYTKEFLK